MVLVQTQRPVAGILPLGTKFQDNPLGNYHIFLNGLHSGGLIEQAAETRANLAAVAAPLSTPEDKWTVSIISRK